MKQSRTHSKKRGSALLVTIILSLIGIGAVASVAAYAMNSARMEKRSNNRTRALYAAEYALQQNYSTLSSWLTTNRPSVPTMSESTGLVNLTTAPTVEFPPSAGYTFRSNLVVPMENGLAVSAHGGLSQSTGVYRFLNIAEVGFVDPAAGGDVTVRVQEQVAYSITPVFKFAIFYNQDLELFPGATFNVAGRVHANGKFYTGSTAGLTFNSAVTSTEGTVVGQYHPNDPRSNSTGNNVNFDGGPAFLTPFEEPPSAFAQESGTNPNHSGPRELIEIPDANFADPHPDERMYTNAGLKVLVNSNGSGTVTSPDGTPVSAADRYAFLTHDGTAIPTADPMWNIIEGALTPGSIQDNREGALISTTDIDVGALATKVDTKEVPTQVPNLDTWPNTSAYPPALRGQPISPEIRGKTLWNGQLHITDLTNQASNRKAVRLVKGENLPLDGLTVSTENAAYIVGNYNTGGEPPVNSSSSLTASNMVSGHQFRPAAVVADAVTIVSKNWDTGNYNSKSLSERIPAPTTVNTAIISGIVPSSSDAYSGGAENYLRLLENWSSKRLTYYGSMVTLYNSLESTGNWRYGSNVYNAPKRNWYFDVNFNDPNKLPKGTPNARSMRRGQWAQIN